MLTRLSLSLSLCIFLALLLCNHRENLTERAEDFWLVLEDVAITDLSFGAEYSRAVEAKQVAQQEAQRAAMLVERAKQERQQKIVEAEAESESATLIGTVRCKVEKEGVKEMLGRGGGVDNTSPARQVHERMKSLMLSSATVSSPYLVPVSFPLLSHPSPPRVLPAGDCTKPWFPRAAEDNGGAEDCADGGQLCQPHLPRRQPAPSQRRRLQDLRVSESGKVRWG